MPITSLYAGLLGLLLLLLSLRIVYFRLTHRIGIGDGDRPEVKRAIRVQANFIEYVPLILLLMALCEFQHLNPTMLHGMGATLMIARLLHALGLSGNPGVSAPRFIGSTLTFTLLFVASALCVLKGVQPG